ncbi:MAG: PTS sugar transporter subunit IIB [Nanoarchaeota archaeon]
MKILTVCGAGQGSSLILKMNVQDVVNELGIDAKVDNSNISTAKNSDADVIFVGEFNEDALDEFEIPVISISDFMDNEEIKDKLQNFFKKRRG